MKKKSILSVFFRTMKVMDKRLLPYLTAMFFMSTSMAVFGVMEGLLMKAVVDIAQSGQYGILLPTMGMIILGGAVSLLVYRMSGIVYNVEAKRVYGVLSEKVLETAISLPYSYYEKHHSGEIIAKVSYDMGRMGDIFGSRLRRVVMPLLQVSVFLVPMCVLDFRLTLCLVGVNALMLAVDMLTVKPLHQVKTKLSIRSKEMTSALSDILQGMAQIRMNRAGTDYRDRFKKLNHAYAKQYRGQIAIGAFLESAQHGFHLLSTLFFLLIGVYFVSKGYSTLGGLTAIFTIYKRFSDQFLMLGKYIPELVGCLSNAENIFSFLEEEREKDPGEKAEENRKEKDTETPLQVSHLSFSYTPETEVLFDLSFTVKRGECVALTGPSGCGKTTLSKLILGLYPLEDTRSIKLWGIPMDGMRLSELRRKIAYVPQESFFFCTTIRENIRYGRPEATDEEIVEAAKLANAHGFISALPEGYDTVLYERGRNLSGGQRQRLAIARALLKGAGLLLMDEATSALDGRSESLIHETIEKLKGKQTVMMIAHRPKTIALSDRVISCNVPATST